MSKTMLKDGHFAAEDIQARTEDIAAQWAELKEIAQARQDVSQASLSLCV